MKRLQVSTWSRRALAARSGASSIPRQHIAAATAVRCQSSFAAAAAIEPEHHDLAPPRKPLPSPTPDQARQSAKLAALHARLHLATQLPVQTLARALIHPSADAAPRFNNASLAALGSALLNVHVLEYLVCKWPRLPIRILYEVLRAYAGPVALHRVAESWGVEDAAAPGEEVDPGLLQWSVDGNFKTNINGGTARPEDKLKVEFRRGVSSRVVYDDAFGDKVGFANASATPEGRYGLLRSEAFGSFAQATIGSIYTHCGRDAAKAFITSHILSRELDISRMFRFTDPVRELSRLCARESFQDPVARLESETGRLSRTPVYIVGIYCGNDKLAEAAGSTLVQARQKASIAALKAWYLYSPGGKVRVPSDMWAQDAKPWTPPHIDIGEIV
jgi:dsRNA-specific ribonuclease